jgi:hypothetical protein
MGMPGTATGGGDPAVLEDPTGRRARWMGRAGRVVFVLFLGWLLAIVLGGLGLMPVAGIPLAHVLKAPQGPPPLVKLPQPRMPSASDLRPALPARVFAEKTASAARRASHGKSGTAHKNTSTTPRRAGVHGRRAAAPGHTKTTPAAGTAHGKSTTPPGKASTTPMRTRVRGGSAVAPGQTKATPAGTAAHGNVATRPAKATTTVDSTAVHGLSTVAPGQTRTTTTSVPKPKKT